MRITCKTLSGESYPIDCEPVTKLLKIREQLASLINTSPSQLRLIFSGSQLSDDASSLSEYNITDNSTIHVVLRKNDTSRNETKNEVAAKPKELKEPKEPKEPEEPKSVSAPLKKVKASLRSRGKKSAAMEEEVQKLPKEELQMDAPMEQMQMGEDAPIPTKAALKDVKKAEAAAA